MMVQKNVPPNMRVIDETLLYPRYPSGMTENQNPIIRYRHSNMNEPTLKIVEYIYDYNGNYIAPGIYELALSDDKEFLLLMESHNLVAVIPVFKIAQNDAEIERLQKEKSEANKLLKSRKVRRKEKIQSIARARMAEDAITPPEEYIYMNAEIEYVEDGGYYLITYENGAYRAWGAIKVRNKFGGKSPAMLRGKDEDKDINKDNGTKEIKETEETDEIEETDETEEIDKTGESEESEELEELEEIDEPEE